MSKKNKNRFKFSNADHNAILTPNQHAEYKMIKWDLVRLLIFNVVVLAGVLALYYTNRTSGFLENWLSRFI